MRDVIFDFDGTLVDSLPGIAWSIEAAFRECGLPWRDRQLKPLIGPPIRRILADVSGMADARALDRLEHAFRCSYDSSGWQRTVCQEGAAEMLRQMQMTGISLWLVTNKPAGATLRILRELSLADFFEDVVCRDSRVPAFGSKGEMLADLAARHELRHAACLMVGDTMEDALAAAAAGMECVLMCHGYGWGLDGRLLHEWNELLELCGVGDLPQSAAVTSSIGDEI